MHARGNIGASRTPVRNAVLPGSVWSSDVVIERLRRAALVVQHLPPGAPTANMVRQVDVVRSFWEAYGAEQAKLSSVRPSGRDIDDADEALAWLLWLDAADRLLVWARACGLKWRHLERRFAMTERGLRKRHRRVVLQLVLRLNA
jgi:hypothetical protein